MDLVVAEACKVYNTIFQNFLSKNPQAGEADVGQFHEQRKAQFLLRIANGFNLQFENWKKKCEAEVRLCLEECLKDYQKAMRGVLFHGSYTDEQRNVLLTQHKEEKSKACKKFNTACPPGTSDTLKDDCTDELVEEMEAILVKNLEQFDTMKRITEERIQTNYLLTKKSYDQKVTKHILASSARVFFLAKEPDIQKIHDQLVDEVLARSFGPSGSARQTESEQTALKNLYRRHAYPQFQDEVYLLRNGVHPNPVIGIDIGYDNCYVSIITHGKSEMVKNEVGQLETPTYVTLEVDGRKMAIVGTSAKEISSQRPQSTVFDLKNMIGKKFNEYKMERSLNFCPFSVVRDEDDGRLKVDLNGTRYYPEQIYATLLDKLRKQAEAHIEGQINKIVLTAPTYFSEEQRAAMKSAGELVGIEVLDIISEPNAAISAYNLQYADNPWTSRKIVVFNLERSSCDVTLFNIDANGMKMLGTDSDSKFGFRKFTQKLVDYCLDRFEAVKGIHLRKELKSAKVERREGASKSLERLRSACETKTEEIFHSGKIKIRLDEFFEDGFHLEVAVSREQFDNLNVALFAGVMKIVEGVLEKADVRKNQVDNIILTGGGTKLHKIRQLLETYFPGKLVHDSINPEEVIARGAATYAAILNGIINST